MMLQGRQYTLDCNVYYFTNLKNSLPPCPISLIQPKAYNLILDQRCLTNHCLRPYPHDRASSFPWPKPFYSFITHTHFGQTDRFYCFSNFLHIAILLPYSHEDEERIGHEWGYYQIIFLLQTWISFTWLLPWLWQTSCSSRLYQLSIIARSNRTGWYKWVKIVLQVTWPCCTCTV